MYQNTYFDIIVIYIVLKQLNLITFNCVLLSHLAHLAKFILLWPFVVIILVVLYSKYVNHQFHFRNFLEANFKIS